MKRSLTFLSLFSGAALTGGLLMAEDWPQWGRTDDKNMVSPEKNIPGAEIEPGKFKKRHGNGRHGHDQARQVGGQSGFSNIRHADHRRR